MTHIVYEFAKEFSRYPGGRLRIHGPKSGQEFREDALFPLFEKYEFVTIDLSNSNGFGSSFLDESFGELGKRYGMVEIRRRLTIIADDFPMLSQLVWEKIGKGAAESKN